MTDVDSILDNATQWATEGVTKPTIKTGQLHSVRMMTRGIIVKKVTRDDELIGVVDRSKYSVRSHDAWVCAITTMTSADDLENIIGCIYRIIAEYTQTSTETYLDWQGGTYDIWNNKRWTFRFAILRNKALQSEF